MSEVIDVSNNQKRSADPALAPCVTDPTPLSGEKRLSLTIFVSNETSSYATGLEHQASSNLASISMSSNRSFLNDSGCPVGSLDHRRESDESQLTQHSSNWPSSVQQSVAGAGSTPRNRRGCNTQLGPQQISPNSIALAAAASSSMVVVISDHDSESSPPASGTNKLMLTASVADDVDRRFSGMQPGSMLLVGGTNGDDDDEDGDPAVVQSTVINHNAARDKSTTLSQQGPDQSTPPKTEHEDAEALSFRSDTNLQLLFSEPSPPPGRGVGSSSNRTGADVRGGHSYTMCDGARRQDIAPAAANHPTGGALSQAGSEGGSELGSGSPAASRFAELPSHENLVRSESQLFGRSATHLPEAGGAGSSTRTDDLILEVTDWTIANSLQVVLPQAQDWLNSIAFTALAISPSQFTVDTANASKRTSLAGSPAIRAGGWVSQGTSPRASFRQILSSAASHPIPGVFPERMRDEVKRQQRSDLDDNYDARCIDSPVPAASTCEGPTASAPSQMAPPLARQPHAPPASPPPVVSQRRQHLRAAAAQQNPLAVIFPERDVEESLAQAPPLSGVQQQQQWIGSLRRACQSFESFTAMPDVTAGLADDDDDGDEAQHRDAEEAGRK